MNSGVPDTGLSKTWFDDIGLIQWDSLRYMENQMIDVKHPNNYNYIQFFTSGTPNEQIQIALKNTIIGELPDLKSIPKCTKNIIAVPGYAHFFDESEGPIGNWLWEFGDNSHSTIRHPSHYFQKSRSLQY